MCEGGGANKKKKRKKDALKFQRKKHTKSWGNTLQNTISKSFSKQKDTLTHTITLQKTQAASM